MSLGAARLPADWPAPFRRVFTRPTFDRLCELGAGTLLASGARTVASGLRAVGRGGVPVHRFETPILAYAAMSTGPIWSARTWAGVRWPCRSTIQPWL